MFLNIGFGSALLFQLLMSRCMNAAELIYNNPDKLIFLPMP